MSAKQEVEAIMEQIGNEDYIRNVLYTLIEQRDKAKVRPTGKLSKDAALKLRNAYQKVAGEIENPEIIMNSGGAIIRTSLLRP